MFSPKYIYWELCDFCNLSCKHCFANSNPQNTHFVDSNLLWAKIVEINNQQHVPIRFGGGEPLLYPGLLDLLEKGHQYGISMSITTNGTLLTDTAIKKFVEHDLDSLTISIDGMEEYHNYLRGAGSFSRATLGLNRAIKAHLNVSVSFTITSFNFENLIDYVGFFYQEGIRDFYLFRYIPDIEGRRSPNLELSKKQLMDVTMTIKRLKLSYPDAKFHYERKGHLSFLIDENDRNAECKFTKGVVTIQYDGTVVVCAAISKKLGNIYQDSLKQIYETISNEIKCINYIPNSCRDCSFGDTCRGSCKSHSYICYRDYSHPDDCCYRELLL